MPRYRVIGDIVSGAFSHAIEADSEEDAMDKVRNEVQVRDLDSVSSEKEFPRPDSVEEIAEGEEL